jgi:hypothetical protein
MASVFSAAAAGAATAIEKPMAQRMNAGAKAMVLRSRDTMDRAQQ